MFKWIVNLFDRFLAVVIGLTFSQVPLFMTQYQQHLEGHINELHYLVAAMQQAAKSSGKTLEQYIQKFAQSQDPDFLRQGELMQEMVHRWNEFTASLHALSTATPWARPFAFLTHINWDIFKSTLDSYAVGIPLNLEGGLYVLVGIALGYSLFATLRYGCRKFYRFLFGAKTITHTTA